MALPGIFCETILSRKPVLTPSPFIRSMHPKTQIKPEESAMRRILDQGWWAQMKIHGHRAQIHLASSNGEPTLIAYTRKGSLHTKEVPEELKGEIFRLFSPKEGWSAIDCEWVKSQGKLYLFDYLKKDGHVLRSLNYRERYEMLPQVYQSDLIETLPVYKSVRQCLEVLFSPNPLVEGLVFKSTHSPGFSDTAIVRCRKP